MSDVKTYFIENLKYLKMRHSMNNDDLAEATGVKHFANYSSGRNKPPIEILIKLSRIFEVTIDDLLTIDLKTRDISKASRNPTQVLQDGDEEWKWKKWIEERLDKLESK